jgi:tyrosine-protein kinase Etk/Wzc
MEKMKDGAVIPLNDEVDIRSTLDLIMSNAKPIAVSIVAFVLLGAMYQGIATPVYRADITVQIEASTDLASTAISSVAGGLSSLFDIKSTDASPKRFPLVGATIAKHNHGLSTPGIFGVGGYGWGNEKIDVASFDVPRAFEDDTFTVTVLGDSRFRLSGSDLGNNATGQVGSPLIVDTAEGQFKLVVTALNGELGAAFNVRRHSRQKVVQELREKLKIAEMGKDQSGVIGVSYDDVDPARAAAILNSIAENYVRQNRDRKSATANQSLEFLKGQLPDVQHQLEQAENKLTDYQNHHKVVDLSDQAKAVLGQSTDAQTGLVQLQQKRKEMLATMSERHPAIVALDQQITAARENLADFERAMQRLPDDQQGIVRLTRDVRVNTEIYTGLLNSIQQLRLAEAGGVGNVRVIDHAVVPEEPARPKPLIVLALSLVGGLVFGMAGCITRAALSGRVTDPTDIERQTLMNVAAVIPVSDGQRRLTRLQRKGLSGPHVLAIRARRDPAVEALRTLRTAVQFALADKTDTRIVLVTGPTEAVGKSFTAANLAVLLGSSDKRVLLVDADLRRGHLASDFAVGEGAGLADVLQSTTSLGAAIVATTAPNVDFLRAGRVFSDADELLGKAGVTDHLRALTVGYDVVVLDSPPVLAVSDTTLLAAVADVVLLVVRSGKTTGGEIVEAVKRLERASTNATQVVFNGFRPGLRSKQYGYYGYRQRYDARVPAAATTTIDAYRDRT